MRGSIVKKGNKYYVVVDAPPTAAGKRRQQWHGSWERKKDAEHALNEIVGRVQKGIVIDPTRVTLGDYLTKQWLPNARQLTPSTAELYATIIRAYIEPHIGEVRLQQLTAAHLDGLYTVLSERGKRNGAGLSAKMVRNVHLVLHAALKSAEKKDLVVRNVAASAEPPRVVPPRPKAWTAEQLRTFLDATTDDRFGALWQLLATTGMRRGEALALRWECIDAKAATARIDQTVAWVGKQVTFQDPKTSSSRRLVQLAPATVSSLMALRKRQVADRLAAGAVYADSGLVFADELGAPITPGIVTKNFGAAAKRAGLPHLTPHGLRHSWATIALGAGVPSKVASEMLGHSSVAMTLDIYASVTQGMTENAAHLVARIMDGSASA